MLSGLICFQEFESHAGRPPSILIARVAVNGEGLDYSKQMADVFSDLGYNVKLLPGTSVSLGNKFKELHNEHVCIFSYKH